MKKLSKCTHLLRDFKLGLTTQSARALPASNWTEFLISEIFIRVSAQNCHSEIFQSAAEKQEQMTASKMCGIVLRDYGKTT